VSTVCVGDSSAQALTGELLGVVPERLEARSHREGDPGGVALILVVVAAAAAAAGGELVVWLTRMKDLSQKLPHQLSWAALGGLGGAEATRAERSAKYSSTVSVCTARAMMRT